MKKRPLRRVLVTIAVAGMLPLTSVEISAQGKKPPPPSRAAPPQVSNTKLEVRASNGQIAYWADSVTTNSKSPEVTLRYSTTQPDATQAEWHLLDKAPSNDPRKSKAQGPQLLGGRGLGRIPPHDEFKVFEISLAPFPKPLPETPRVFWVVVVTKNAQNQLVGVASAPVKIIYKAL